MFPFRSSAGASRLLVHQLKGSLLGLLVSVTAIGGVIYHFSEQQLVESIKSSLIYHAEFRNDRIQALFRQQSQWMLETAGNEAFKQRVDQLVSSFRLDEEHRAYTMNSERMRVEYSPLLRAQGVEDLFLINDEGKLVYSLRPMDEELGVDLTADGFYGRTMLSDLIEDVLKKGELVISKYGKIEQMEESSVLMGIPLFSNFPGNEGDLLAIVVRPFSLYRLRALLESYSGLGESGEVMIAQWRGDHYGEGVNFINHFRDGLIRQPDEECQLLRVTKPELFPMMHALEKKNGAGWKLDNSCRTVYAVWSWLPELQWGMVVKQDQEEIMFPVSVLQRNIAIASVFVLFFLFWLVKRQAHALVRPIERLTEEAERGEIDAHEPGDVEEVNHLAVVLKQSTADLVQAKRETEMIIDSMDEGLMVIDKNNLIVRANPKLERMVGEKVSDLVGRQVGCLFTVDRQLRCKSGETIPVSVSQALLEGQDQAVVMVHDISQVLRAESAIEANKAKDRFLAVMSHELRTPLTSIIGYSEMLSRYSSNRLDEKEQKMLHAIEVAGRTQLSLINDILDLSKIEAGKFEIDEDDFDLNVLLEEVNHIFSIRAQEAGLEFAIVQRSPLRHMLVGDSKRVGQILLNLLSNAIKFTEKGKISLEVVVAHAERQIEFRVEDQGIGMSKEVLDRLFQPFEQADSTISRRFGGTGLGLHISWTLAELMGGTIHVESEEGIGSQFTLALPYRLSERRIRDRQSTEYNRAPLRFSGTVLLVEDTAELQKLEQAMLESVGVNVMIAANGQDAVEVALSQHFDLILMDMQMPIMNGIVATSTLRALHYDGPIVALTANVMPQHQEEFKEAESCPI